MPTNGSVDGGAGNAIDKPKERQRREKGAKSRAEYEANSISRQSHGGAGDKPANLVQPPKGSPWWGDRSVYSRRED
jgi:hypothetical protein